MRGRGEARRCGRHAHLQHLRGFGGPKAEHVAEDQHRALARWELLEPRDEGEADPLSCRITGIGLLGTLEHSPEELVRIRLEPDRLDLARRGGGGGSSSGEGGSGILRPRARSAFREWFGAIVQSHVRIDARPSKPSSPRHAARSVSWTMSCASWSEPTIR
jgi:hypothetical protein